MINKRISQTLTCRQCGAEFQPFRASKGFFCSNTCKFKAKETDHNYICAGCGKEFFSKKQNPKYCTNECYQEKKRNTPLRERLYSKIKKTDHCWVWTGNINEQGYGRVAIGKDIVMAHRAVYELETGEDISEKVVRHFICDNPPCCNPAHLRSGTKAENSQDAVNHKRHAHGETSYAKLNAEQVIKIRADDRTQEEIAREYGVSRRTISHIKLGNTWKHLV